jgi:hypothetical protein
MVSNVPPLALYNNFKLKLIDKMIRKDHQKMRIFLSISLFFSWSAREAFFQELRILEKLASCFFLFNVIPNEESTGEGRTSAAQRNLGHPSLFVFFLFNFF